MSDNSEQGGVPRPEQQWLRTNAKIKAQLQARFTDDQIANLEYLLEKLSSSFNTESLNTKELKFLGLCSRLAREEIEGYRTFIADELAKHKKLAEEWAKIKSEPTEPITWPEPERDPRLQHFRFGPREECLFAALEAERKLVGENMIGLPVAEAVEIVYCVSWHKLSTKKKAEFKRA